MLTQSKRARCLGTTDVGEAFAWVAGLAGGLFSIGVITWVVLEQRRFLESETNRTAELV